MSSKEEKDITAEALYEAYISGLDPDKIEPADGKTITIDDVERCENAYCSFTLEREG